MSGLCLVLLRLRSGQALVSWWFNVGFGGRRTGPQPGIGADVKEADRSLRLNAGTEQVAERLTDAVDALDFVFQARDDRAFVRERTADVFHVPLLRGDAVENELMGLVYISRTPNTLRNAGPTGQATVVSPRPGSGECSGEHLFRHVSGDMVRVRTGTARTA